MNVYAIWCNLKNSAHDVEFCRAVDQYLGHLRDEGVIEGFRVLRRKLGFGPPGLGEFHILIETRDLAQLDAAFNTAATRTPPVETLHAAVFNAVKDTTFALYRDFPDPVRGE